MKFIPFTLGLLASAALLSAETLPTEIKFTRQAVKRMIFDNSQALPLATLDPAKTVGFELMHPVSHRGPEKARVSGLQFEAAGASDTGVWLSGFNPFATYEASLSPLKGSVRAGFEFRHEKGDEILRVEAVSENEVCQGIEWSLTKGGKLLLEGRAKPEAIGEVKGRVQLLVQMVATGFNVYLSNGGMPRLVGRAEVVQHLDLRRKEVFQAMSAHLRVASSNACFLNIGKCSASLTPGMGQADIRVVTDEEGAPLLDDGRLWFTATVRGGGLPHPAQGVFSMDPGVFDPRFEGMIVFDRGDGLLRNDLASHLFLDRKSGEWRGWTTGFSAFGDPAKQEKKEILAIRGTKDPRKGFSVMKASPMGLVGDYEDPHGVFDKDAGKWRMLLCQNAGGYKAAVFESTRWDGDFTRIAGPVASDSTGTTLQKVDGTRYAFFGSADRSFHVCSFPDLKPLGKLDVAMPPWPENGNARVWPCIVPLPEGYSSPYLMLSFDRENFPGMEGPNWTYGAMYLYHGNITAPASK